MTFFVVYGSIEEEKSFDILNNGVEIVENQVRELKPVQKQSNEAVLCGIVFLLAGIGVYLFFLFLDPAFLVYWNGVPLNKEIVSVLCFIIAALFFWAVYFGNKEFPQIILIDGDKIQIDKSVYFRNDISACEDFMYKTGVMKFQYKNKKTTYCFKNFNDEACQDIHRFFMS